jgi:general stress protein 26
MLNRETTEDLVKKYLQQGRMMQIATVSGDKPWICTVYFVPDEQQNLYWLSQDIAKNSKIAVAIAVKFDKNPIIGIQAEGIAEIVNEGEVVKKILPDYVEKYGSGKDFVELFESGKNQHQLYKFTPSKYFLFDETNFSDGQKHEWSV